MNTTITEDARSLREIRKERDEAKRIYDELDEQFKLAQRDLLDRMQEDGVDGLKVDGTNFVPAETVYGQVQDRSEFVAWAQVHDDELLEQREIKERINALVRAHLDDGQPLPPGLGFYVREYISQRAA